LTRRCSRPLAAAGSHRWHTALDRAADKFGGWIESGEGDPTDLYFCRYWPLDELAVE